MENRSFFKVKKAENPEGLEVPKKTEYQFYLSYMNVVSFRVGGE
jgi:hypothetical protein